ncbi:MAG: hypothetical protein JJT94_03710 [Bernardetiaceae bacterium]|nr:hypothetical protein [Bernardetiaceae bacterium]
MLSESNSSLPIVKGWIYLNEDKTEMLRIENFDSFDFKLAYGKIVPADNFQNLLSASSL